MAGSFIAEHDGRSRRVRAFMLARTLRETFKTQHWPHAACRPFMHEAPHAIWRGFYHVAKPTPVDQNAPSLEQAEPVQSV